MYDDIKEKFKNLEDKLSNPEIVNNPEKLKSVSREHANLKELIEMILNLEKTEKNIKENEEVIAKENDSEIKTMASEEIIQLKNQAENLKNKIEEELHPADPNDKKNVIVEIRAGTGGDESALFTAELFRLYSRFAERMGWKINIYNSSRIGIGGFKEVIFSVEGKNVYGSLKFEAGTHRVQRVPETEKAGRIHTSAVTVAVLPEAEEVELEIKPQDIRIDTYAASGPGGQCVNTTNSAVRITHLPTGVVVQCQDQKDQHQNKAKAMLILRSRILQKLEEEKNAKESAERKSQIGSGDRSEKIRTYNFPQDRITDHRIKMNWHSIERVMDGDIGEIIEELKKAEKALRK
ncbi:MAG: peptide chain release factor 1 [Patescibacteria group bacterium]|nr:peptide chain release factor 1 [Patescibacteria group bacterium]MDD4611012.1 peptide chain release factor 1 [Patescibacteria group bacterium]